VATNALAPAVTLLRLAADDPANGAAVHGLGTKVGHGCLFSPRA
jgi:hypothetical protein